MCGRRRGGLLHDEPLALLLRVTDLDDSNAVDPTQLVSAPVECNSATQLDADGHLGINATRSLDVYKPLLQLPHSYQDPYRTVRWNTTDQDVRWLAWCSLFVKYWQSLQYR